MGWQDAMTLLHLLAQQHVGAPGRIAELRREEEEIEKLRMKQAETADLRDY